MPAAVAIPAAVAGGGALLSYFGQQQAIDAQKDANKESMKLQKQSLEQQLALQKEQYDQTRTDLSEYRLKGGQGLDLLSTLLGANGADAQGMALSQFSNDPTLRELITQGERGVLKGASATGKLRSGSAQSAVATVAPSILQDAINQRISQLGGLASIGQNAANMTSSAGVNMANQSGNAYSNFGNNASEIAQSNGQLNSVNPLLNAMGYGLGYLGSPQGNGLLSEIQKMFPSQQPNSGMDMNQMYTLMRGRG
jgi:hypothetical protein